MQNIEDKVFKEFEKLIKEKRINSADSRVIDSGRPDTSWMNQVTQKIKISVLARQNNIVECPVCMKYKVNFDDGKGWFACQDGGCDFRGNIVDFVEKTGCEI